MIVVPGVEDGERPEFEVQLVAVSGGAESCGRFDCPDAIDKFREPFLSLLAGFNADRKFSPVHSLVLRLQKRREFRSWPGKLPLGPTRCRR